MSGDHRAVSTLYQALLTGLVLTLVTRRGEADAAEFVFRLFRRQHLDLVRGLDLRHPEPSPRP